MPAKPTLRIDLGELDPYFEKQAVAKGKPVNSVLGEALERLLTGEVAIPKQPDKRTRRTVTFASADERAQAHECAQALDQPLSTVLRAVAIDRLLAQSGGNANTGAGAGGASSGGAVVALGLGESSTERVELRLNPSELAALEEKAQAGRYRSTQALLIAITRAFLLNAPVLDPAVVSALGQHNLQLVHISNSVSQLVRDLEGRKRLGAISAAVTALIADQTRDSVRTKAMALVGASISLVFALSLVLSPLLNAQVGLQGLFLITGVLASAGIAVVLWWVPPEPVVHAAPGREGLALVLRDAALLRLDLGAFILHAVQFAMWMAVPAMLVQAGLDKSAHWQVYLPAVMGSFVVMGATLFPLEKRGYLRAVFLSAIGVIALVQLGLLYNATHAPTLAMLAVLMLAFFCGFNILEASQPSMASRLAPAHSRGAALGVYNTLQSLGFFAGGAMGGWVLGHYGAGGLFASCAALMVLWLAVAWPMA